MKQEGGIAAAPLILKPDSSESRVRCALSNVPVTESIQDRIVREVSSWEGVTTAPHRFGGIEFRLGDRELGHLHGNRQADLPFPVRVREQLVANGEAEPHHIFPQSGWVSFHIHSAEDIPRVIALFRLSYDRPWSTPQAA